MSAGVAPACSMSVTAPAAPTLASSLASVASDANGSTWGVSPRVQRPSQLACTHRRLPRAVLHATPRVLWPEAFALHIHQYKILSGVAPGPCSHLLRGSRCPY